MFVFLSTDKDKVIKLLDKFKGNQTVSIFGLKEWADWKEVNGTIMNKYEFTYASPTHFDLRDPQVINFHKQYRRFYGADLTKTACQGYDAVLNVCSAFFLDKELKKGLINSYQLNQIGKGNGIQNEGGFVLKFQDFEPKVDNQ
jgi:ABC-type branched-subunit amino acid transport system substrate-binding protein